MALQPWQIRSAGSSVKAIAYRFLFPAMWLSWVLYWWLLSARVKPNRRREPLGSRLLHFVPLAVAVALIWPAGIPGARRGDALYVSTAATFWGSAFVTGAGLLFTVWARVHLWRNWSGSVTLKQGHELIDSGPYALVRHPIYSGLLVAFLGSAIALGEWRGVLAVLIVLAAFWRKLRMEERWMSEQFAEAYAAYMRRVPALVPFWKRAKSEARR